MKEKTIIELKNNVEGIKRVLQQVVTEITHLRELGVGTLETLKLMPGYDKAIEDLQKNMEEQAKEQSKAEQNGTSE
jgi:regulator of replication initiation timing